MQEADVDDEWGGNYPKLEPERIFWMGCPSFWSDASFEENSTIGLMLDMVAGRFVAGGVEMRGAFSTATRFDPGY